MRRNFFQFAFFALALSILGSCSRKDDEDPGLATLKLTPQHHGKNIDSCMVFIKFDAIDVPSGYDDSAWVKQENGKPVATFTGLKKGNYYLFGKGWDPSILQEVKGGMPYTIKEDKVIELSLPVTEDH